MKKIKAKILVLVLTLVMLTTMTGCGSNKKANRNNFSNKEDFTVSDNYSTAGNSGIFTKSMVRGKLNNTQNAKSATVLVYMNGSNLESDDSEATTDISEMVAANYSSDVNIVIQTMGTKKWNSKYGIASNKSQRYQVVEDGLKLVDDNLPQLDCTEAATLLDFINWGVKNYKADRYILMFWDHGGGPVYGFGYDEWNSDSNATLTIDEIKLAVNNSGVKFDFIGMDCCIMSCLETCMAFYEFADYVILSEEFETGLGWSYTGWINELVKNPAIDTETLAKTIVDDMVAANENDSFNGGSVTLACIDESLIKVLYTAWMDFAYENEATLLEKNFSRNFKGGKRSVRSGNYSIGDYFITDIMSVVDSVNSTKSQAVKSALNNAMVYYRETSDETAMGGMAVTLPYGRSAFYKEMKTVFTNCGFDSNYIAWLEKFVSASGNNSYYDYSDWDNNWDGWDSYEDDYNWSDWDYTNDDNYWYDDEDWGWSDWNYDDYWDSCWYDSYWDSYDSGYWYEDDEDYWYDEDYGYYNPADDVWYDDYDSWSGWYDDWDYDEWSGLYDDWDYDDYDNYDDWNYDDWGDDDWYDDWDDDWDW